MKHLLVERLLRLKFRFEETFTKEERLTLALGLLGFLLIYRYFPSDWSLPEYALY